MSFYGDLVENLKAWQAKAPKLPPDDGEGEPVVVDDPRRNDSPPSAVPAVLPLEEQGDGYPAFGGVSVRKGRDDSPMSY